MTKLAIQVLMYPHNSRPSSFQQFSWHRPANIRLHLTPAGGGTAIDLVTGPKGVARGNVPQDDYTVSLPELTSSAGGQEFFYVLAPAAPPIAKPARPAVIDVGAAPKAVELHLFPDNGNWLVPLWLKLGTKSGRKPAGVAGTGVTVTDAGGSKSFTSLGDGHVFATASAGDVMVRPTAFPNLAPVPAEFIMRAGQEQESVEVEYRPRRARIAVTPRLKSGDAIAGVTFELSRPGQGIPLSQVSQGSQACVFDDLMPGQVTVKVIPPAQFDGTPIALIGKTDCVSVSLASGDDLDLSQRFRFKYQTGSISGRVVDEEDKPIGGISIVAATNGQSTRNATSGKNGKYSIRKLRAGQWTIMLEQSTVRHGGETLVAQPGWQDLTVHAGKTAKAFDFKLEPDDHGIRGQVTDSDGKPFPNAIVEIRDQRMRVIATVVTDAQGNYSWQSQSSGMFVVNLLTRDGRTVQREAVTVNSWTILDMRAPDTPDSPGPQGPGPGGSGTNQGSGAPSVSPEVREAVTDLAAYPLLTEEISTTGSPGPAGGGTSGGAAGAGYGQIVDQAMRDVLGWRPGGDPSGFQAALTGAFQLREVEGHTEWTWQQRGYAVQADMGALTGAQAAIYARAKSALDQILPLLAGLTPLNPALFPPQDLEAIRTVITAELQELVSELALQGGPRIQRVDQLFHLLTGERTGSRNLNPDVVQGNLGILRERFGLTADEIDTVDEERIVTNFRIVVEQVLSLQATWSTDRGLLAPLDPRASFGTVLIWLSRSLEAVCESVSDLNFALDSVFVDAAQRQVIELKFPGEEALLLSDLLDWVDRASRDEGPRIIQDAGKDGVFAFAPVLRRLRDLIRATRHAARHDRGLPDGMRTPRVDRALQVLISQLDEATELATAVRRDAPPLIQGAQVSEPGKGTPTSLAQVSRRQPSIQVDIFGANFRPNASVVLIAQDREDLPELHTRSIKVTPPSLITTTFRNPATVRDSAGVTWLVAVTNEDGTHSNQFPI